METWAMIEHLRHLMYQKLHCLEDPNMINCLQKLHTIFTREQEAELKRYALTMEERLFGLSIDDFRSLAYQYADLNNIPHNFPIETGLAGRDWVNNFMRRHSELSLRQPESTSAARACAFNRTIVAQFLSLLENLMITHNFPPRRIYNCDETGISTVPTKMSKVLSLKGKKQVGALASAERGTLTTAEICFNAVGHYIPPFMVFPRVKTSVSFSQGLPPESVVACHPSGWMQMDKVVQPLFEAYQHLKIQFYSFWTAILLMSKT